MASVLGGLAATSSRKGLDSPLTQLSLRFPQSHINPHEPAHSQGLSSAEAHSRLLQDGPNLLAPPKKVPIYWLFFKQFLGNIFKPQPHFMQPTTLSHI